MEHQPVARLMLEIQQYIDDSLRNDRRFISLHVLRDQTSKKPNIAHVFPYFPHFLPKVVVTTSFTAEIKKSSRTSQVRLVTLGKK